MAVQLRPEQEVILAAVRGDRAGDERVRELIKGGLDWAVLHRIALQHGVLPLLYRELKAVGEALVPPEEMIPLKKLFLNNALRNQTMAQKLVHVLDLLSSTGIEAIPFKGPILALQAYGTLSWRHFGDLDILIHHHDFQRAYEQLASAGYSPTHSVDKKWGTWVGRVGKELTFSDQDVSLDIHWGITGGGFLGMTIDQGAFWQDLRLLDINSHQVRVFSPENTVLLLCIHGTQHGWQALSLIADLAHLIRNHPDLDWRGLFRHAKRVRAQRVLRLGLQLAQEIAGAPLPPEVESVFHARPSGADLAAEVKGNLFADGNRSSQFNQATFRARATERLRDRFLHVISLPLVPEPADLAAVRLPGFLYPLYYVIRPVRLLFFKYGPRALRGTVRR